MKWSEGRTTIFGLKSKAWHEREAAKERRALEKGVLEEESSPKGGSGSGSIARVEVV